MSTILVRENITSFEENCLCANFQERTILSQPVVLMNNSRMEPSHQIMINNGEQVVLEVTQYHIIPQQLISSFLRIWLSDDLSNPMYDGLSNCARTLYGRFRRSLQKIFIVTSMNSRDSASENLHELIQNISTHNYIYSTLSGAGDNWLSGNIFLGPRNRGPFDPQFGLNEQDLSQAFETNVESIVGHDRRQQLFNIFQDLLEFVRSAGRWTPFERLTSGFSIFISMTYDIGR